MNTDYILSLYKFYNYIDFNTLSKIKIKEKAKNNDGNIIFALSNMMFITNKEEGKNLTIDQENYIQSIINKYKL